jgi:hypothetical protein
VALQVRAELILSPRFWQQVRAIPVEAEPAAGRLARHYQGGFQVVLRGRRRIERY